MAVGTAEGRKGEAGTETKTETDTNGGFQESNECWKAGVYGKTAVDGKTEDGSWTKATQNWPGREQTAEVTVSHTQCFDSQQICQDLA